jgi:hypothetical protein
VALALMPTIVDAQIPATSETAGNTAVNSFAQLAGKLTVGQA